LRFLDLVTGAQRDGFVIDTKGANIAISPDGQRIAFAERMPVGMDYGLYVAQLDGSDRRLIAQLDHSPLTDPRWSPDGDWLLVGISSPDPLVPGLATALINPATCEAVRLNGIEAYVQDWSR
jgi:dipeptidyl aminopeptidase/acylaminoacyl peptidase